MTLGRRDRAPSTVHGDAPEGWDVAEIEELPAQRVRARGAARPRLGALLAASAGVVLLAGGVGLLGGRAASEPTSASATKVSPSPTSPSATTPPEVVQPLVTPTIPCPDTDDTVVPGVILQVGDVQTPGIVDVINWHGRPGASGAPDAPPGPPTKDRIEVRSDLTSVLSTTDEACAVGWEITLGGPDGSAVLESIGIPAVNPDMARQNRFELPLWQYRGNDYELEAVLVYPHVVIHARWPIRILPFQPPTTLLLSDNRSIPVSPGCNLLLSFGGGGVERLYPCGFDVVSAPPVTGVEPRAQLAFSFSEGWDVEPGGVVCGTLTGTNFEEDTETTCGLDEPVLDPSAPFRAPSRAGTWTMAISACAIQNLADAYNEACGTWYTTLRVRS